MITKAKRPVVTALLTAVLLCMTCSPSFAQGSIQPQSGDIITVNALAAYGQTEARTMLKMINDFRTGSEAWAWDEEDARKVQYPGLKNLVYDYDLEKAAMQRAAEIALSFSHTRPNGKGCFTAYGEQGITSSYARGENIAIGYGTAAAVFDAWKETNESYSGQGHRRNMLSSSFTAVGVGHAVSGGFHCWVQEFQSPPANTTPSEAVDSEKAVPVEVLKSSISKVSVTPAVKTCRVPYKGSVKLPTVKTSITLDETWGSPVSLSVPVQWDIEDKEYAEISEGMITGKKIGTTRLKGTADIDGGKTVIIPLEVTDPNASRIGQVLGVKAAAGKNRMTVSWKKAENADGYQVVWSRNKSFTKISGRTAVKNGGATGVVVKKLQSGKTYYVKVRACKAANGKTLYGPYSNVVKAQIK